MKNKYFKGSSITMGKDGLPEAWRSWTGEMRAAWLDGRLAELEKKTGVKIRELVKREVRNALVRIRVQKKLDSLSFGDAIRQSNAEARAAEAIAAARRRLAGKR